MWKPTGSNVIPLGTNRRRFGEESPESEDNSLVASAHKRKGTRKNHDRWGRVAGRCLLGVPTTLPRREKAKVTEYAVLIRIEEISRYLKESYIPTDDEKMQSYELGNVSQSTLHTHCKKYMEDELQNLSGIAEEKDPNFKPPVEYKRTTKFEDKVYIPVNDFPEINFIGLLIGPRGNTIKHIDNSSGAKISIRGRGSVKEGKRMDPTTISDEDDDLHCLITADSWVKIEKARELVNNIIETSTTIPEGQNELKRQQLRELAQLNGTLRDDENQTCLNCGEIGHRRFECPERENFTMKIKCHHCQKTGHIQRDCPQKMVDFNKGQNPEDPEYANLMAELGEKSSGNGQYGSGNSLPWQQGSGSSGAAPWQQKNQNAQQYPQQAGYEGYQNYGYGDGYAGYDSYYGAYQQGGYGDYGYGQGYDQNAWAQHQAAAQAAGGDAAAPPPPPPPASEHSQVPPPPSENAQ